MLHFVQHDMKRDSLRRFRAARPCFCLFSRTTLQAIAKIRIKISIFEGFMEKMYKYTVAGHTFGVTLPEGYTQEEYLKPYLPFVSADETEPLFRLRLALSDTLKELAPGELVECLNDEAPYFWMFKKEDDAYNFGFSYSKNRPDCVVMPSADIREAVVYVPSAYAQRLAEFAISNAMMLLYTFNTTPLDTLMVHASVVAHEGGAYMFLGRSGTGKSTHSSLWLRNIDNTYLLNDDNPVIRVEGDEINIYGTPWSGKTPCYKNEVLPLKASVRLSQAPHNKIARLTALQSYASLLPACSCMRWDRKSTDALHKTVEKVISKVACWHLECLPDADAAYTCHSAVAATCSSER